MRAGFLIVVITISASAQTREEIATLKAQVAALQSLVASLQTSNTTLQSQIGSLQGQVGSLQTSNATLQSQVGSLQTNDTTLQTGDTALRTQVTAPAEPVDYGPARSRVGSFRQCRSQSGERRDWTLHHFKGANIHIRSKLERSRACVRMIARV